MFQRRHQEEKIIQHGQEEALKFASSFSPDKDADFDWVYDLAKEQHKIYFDTAKNLDDKASSIVTALGGATGIFTLGSIAALGSDKVTPWIVLSAIPCVLSTITSLYFAVLVRTPKEMEFPCPMDAARFVIDLKENGNPKAAFIGSWVLSSQTIYDSTFKKSKYLKQSMIWFLIAIAFLVLPMIVGIIVHWGK